MRTSVKMAFKQVPSAAFGQSRERGSCIAGPVGNLVAGRRDAPGLRVELIQRSCQTVRIGTDRGKSLVEVLTRQSVVGVQSPPRLRGRDASRNPWRTGLQHARERGLALESRERPWVQELVNGFREDLRRGTRNRSSEPALRRRREGAFRRSYPPRGRRCTPAPGRARLHREAVPLRVLRPVAFLAGVDIESVPLERQLARAGPRAGAITGLRSPSSRPSAVAPSVHAPSSRVRDRPRGPGLSSSDRSRFTSRGWICSWATAPRRRQPLAWLGLPHARRV